MSRIPEKQSPVTFEIVRAMLDAAKKSRRQTAAGRRAEQNAERALTRAAEAQGVVRQEWIDRASLEAETAREEAEKAA